MDKVQSCMQGIHMLYETSKESLHIFPPGGEGVSVIHYFRWHYEYQLQLSC